MQAELDLQNEEAAAQIGPAIDSFIANHTDDVDNDLLGIAELSEEEGTEEINDDLLQSQLSESDCETTYLEGNTELPPLEPGYEYEHWEDVLVALESDEEDTDDDDDFAQFSSFSSLTNVANWSIEDANLCYAIKLAIWKIEHQVSNAAFNNRPLSRSELEDRSMSLHRMKKKLKELTGLVPRRVPCCARNCAAYTDNTIRQCQYCGDPIYEDVELASGKITRPRKTFFYFSPIERLLLDFASPETSREMDEYMTYMRQPEELLTDFWQGSHYNDLKHLFGDQRTLALTLSTDGVQNVRQKSSSVWPILLTVLNYPPELRARNMMIVGLIPGPREPAVFSSFFDSLLVDLRRLAEGVQAYDGHRQEHFVLQAHLMVVTGDMPAISKMMAMKGSNGVSPCRFCSIHGQYSPSSRHWYYPRAGQTLQYRQNLRREILMVAAANDERIRKLHGISGLSFLMSVKSLNFPYSFGLDIMHLYSNVAKAMWNTWTGELLPEPVYENSADSYVLTKVQQAEIGKEMVEAAHHVPVFVTRTPRDISKYKNSFKAVDWFEWITVYSSPLLHDRLPQHALVSWRHLVEAVRLSLMTTLSISDIDKMERHFQDFVDTTESIYFQGIPENLAICTSQLHGLLHVGTTIRALGPTYVSWQFGLERFAGKMEPLTTSKSQLNASLYNGLEMLEHLRYVKLLYKLDTTRPASTPYVSKEVTNMAGQKIGTLTGKLTECQLSPAI